MSKLNHGLENVKLMNLEDSALKSSTQNGLNPTKTVVYEYLSNISVMFIFDFDATPKTDEKVWQFLI